MSSKLPVEPAVEVKTVATAAAHRRAVIRSAAVVLLWLGTWPLRARGAPVKLALDAALLVLAWWAVRPGHRHGERWFGKHGHWTSLLDALPLGFGIAAAAELFHMVKG